MTFPTPSFVLDEGHTPSIIPKAKPKIQIVQRDSRGVQVLDTKRGPKSPKIPPKIGVLRGIFDIQLPNTSHTPRIEPRNHKLESLTNG